MPRLAKHNGRYVVDNPNLNLIYQQLLDEGAIIDIDIKVVDKRKISDRQRKLIFAVCHEISEHTGQYDKDYWRLVMQEYNASLRDIQTESLSTCSMTYARHLIETIINFCIEKEIPISRKTLEDGQYRFSEKQAYVLTLKRMCIVCGRRADIHHVDAIGMGRDRSTVSHAGLRAIPLCREHHTEIHTIGNVPFMKKYHIVPITIDEKLEHFIKKGTIKFHKEDINVLTKRQNKYII